MENTSAKPSAYQIFCEVAFAKYEIIDGKMVKVADAPKRIEKPVKKTTLNEVKLKNRELRENIKIAEESDREFKETSNVESTMEILNRIVNLKLDMSRHGATRRFEDKRLKEEVKEVKSEEVVTPEVKEEITEVKSVTPVIKEVKSNNFWNDANLELNELVKSYRRITNLIDKKMESGKDINDLTSLFKLKSELMTQIENQVLRDMKSLNGRIRYSFTKFSTTPYTKEETILMIHELLAYYELISYAYKTCTIKNEENKKVLPEDRVQPKELEDEYISLVGNVKHILKIKGLENAALFPTKYRKH